MHECCCVVFIYVYVFTMHRLVQVSSRQYRPRSVVGALALCGAGLVVCSAEKSCYFSPDCSPAFLLSSFPPAAACEQQTAKESTGIYVKAVTNSHLASAVKRTYQTPYDVQYQQHGSLLLPKIMHAELTTADISRTRTHKNVLVIGDVHGCLSELKQLHQKAMDTLNEGNEFYAVILVGDLVNKGPCSTEVVRYVREQSAGNPDEAGRWFSVRGNHDDAALKAALGDKERRGKEKYRWVEELSDADVEWMSELPYTIRLTKEFTQKAMGAKDKSVDSEPVDCDTMIVHAGFNPDVSLKEQEIGTMITVREVDCKNSDGRTPWAEAWASSENARPYRVIFGHDAKRGLQRFKGDQAIGLDTGAVYGGELTGIVLPSRKIVSVESHEYCPVGRKQKKQ